MIYRVTWHTAKGPLAVTVDAEVNADVLSNGVGGVRIASVSLNTGEGDDRPAGLALHIDDYLTAERLDLYERLRHAAGLCAKCSGQRRYVVRGRKNGKGYKKRVTCTACGGTGKAART